MNLYAVLLTGLLAGGVSCAAVQGGLLAGLVMRQRTAEPAPSAGTARRPAARLVDDLTPVSGFLMGHTCTARLARSQAGTATRPPHIGKGRS